MQIPQRILARLTYSDRRWVEQLMLEASMNRCIVERLRLLARRRLPILIENRVYHATPLPTAAEVQAMPVAERRKKCVRRKKT